MKPAAVHAVCAVVLLAVSSAPRAQVACGDCNLDGSGPNILDALFAAQVSAGARLPMGAQLCACDVDSDGTPTVLDALLIAQVAAVLGVSLSCPASPCVGTGGGAAPTVDLLSPTSGTHTGDIPLSINAGDADADPVALIFQWSTNGGVTYVNATSTGTGSIPTSPAWGQPVPISGTMVWDSATDGVGTSFLQAVQLRVTAWDGTLMGSDTQGFTVDNVPRIGPCRVVTCGQTVRGLTGPGAMAMLPPIFTPGLAGDSEAFVVDVRGRAPGDYVLLTVDNMTTDVELHAPITPPGPPCGDPTTSSFSAWQTGAIIGLQPEHRTFTDVECTLYGDLIPIWIIHRTSAPTASYDLTVDCIPAPCPTGTVDVILYGHLLPIGVAGNTWGADNTSGVTCSAGVGQGEDHVILFRPAATATYTLDVCGGAFDSLLQIQEGNCSGGPIIACNDDGSCGLPGRSEIISVPLTAGVDYYIVIDGEQGVGRTYGLWIDSP